jgi:pilus assembly protein CpaE
VVDRLAKILILGWSPRHLEEMEGELCLLPDLQISRFLLTSESGLASIVRAQLQLQHPDFLIYCAGEAPDLELNELSRVPGPLRPASQLLVTPTPLIETPLMHLAMQAGFRDHLSVEAIHHSLADRLRMLIKERRSTLDVKNRIIAFVSPKGGVGCSTVSASVGHALMTELNQKTLILDLDYQFGTQYLNHGLEPGKGLKQALDHIETLDVLALRAYVCKTATGVDILGVTPAETLISDDIEIDRLLRLIDLLTGEYDNLIIDMPHSIDALYGAVMQRVNRVILIVRQDLALVRHTAKLIEILDKEFDLPRQSMAVVLNGFSEGKPISTDDIRCITNVEMLGVVPLDETSITFAAGLGVPLHLHAPHSSIQRALEKIALDIAEVQSMAASEKNLVFRVLRRLRDQA